MFASTSKYRLDFNSLLSILFTHFLFIRLELPKVDVDFMGTNVLNLFSTNLIKDSVASTIKSTRAVRKYKLSFHLLFIFHMSKN